MLQVQGANARLAGADAPHGTKPHLYGKMGSMHDSARQYRLRPPTFRAQHSVISHALRLAAAAFRQTSNLLSRWLRFEHV